MWKGTHSTQPQLQGNKALREQGWEQSGLGAVSAPGKELEAVGLMGLGQQGRKSASGVGGEKKSHFISEAVSFLCNSPSYSSCPHS